MSFKYYTLTIKNILSEVYTKFKRIQKISYYQVKFSKSKIHQGVIIEDVILGDYTVLFNNVTIFNSNVDAHTYIQKKSTIINAKIGKFCSIAANVSIGPGVHLTTGVSTHPVFYLKNTPLVKKYCEEDLFESSKQCIIGNDVWIAEKAIILDGITIGDGAIIAAGAVVIKDVEPYSIVGGIPAKHIKYRMVE